MAAAPKLKLGDNYDGHTYIGGSPNDKNSWINVDELAASGLSGDDFLKEISKTHPSVVPTLKALSEGRQQVPTGRATTDPYWQTMFTLGHLYDPSLDAVDYPTRLATRKDFGANGASALNLRNANQALGHLGGLMKEFPKVAGSQGLFGLSRMLNMAKNTYAEGNGDPDIEAYNTYRTGLAGELAALFKGKGTSAENEVNKWYANLSPDRSTAQKVEAAKALGHMLNSRLEEMAEQYNRGMGTMKKSFDFLNPDAQKVFSTLQDEGPKSEYDDATKNLLKKYRVGSY